MERRLRRPRIMQGLQCARISRSSSIVQSVPWAPPRTLAVFLILTIPPGRLRMSFCIPLYISRRARDRSCAVWRFIQNSGEFLKYSEKRSLRCDAALAANQFVDAVERDM